MFEPNLLMLGCGVLRREVRLLVEKNGWTLDTAFLPSSLHIDYHRLSSSLSRALHAHRDRQTVVFYGCCHPQMDDLLDQAGTWRVEGQNCIDMLLGPQMFAQELADGAFFLVEDWARGFEQIVTCTFGENEEVVRAIFQSDRSYLLCLRTPCSPDFSALAEQAGLRVGLPVRWLDVGLEHLETTLRQAIERKTCELTTCELRGS
jgi:hypothetical protein